MCLVQQLMANYISTNIRVVWFTQQLDKQHFIIYNINFEASVAHYLVMVLDHYQLFIIPYAHMACFII